MKKVVCYLLLVVSLAFGAVEGCAPTNSQEGTQETTAEVAQEKVQEATTEATTDAAPADKAPEPAAEPTQEPTPEPIIEPIPEPSPEPVVEPAQEPVQESANEPTQESISEPISESVLDGGEGGFESSEGVPESLPEGTKTTFKWTGEVFEFFGSGNPGIESVKICVYQNAAVPCAMSDASGKFQLDQIPLRSDVYITFEKATYTPLIIPLHVLVSDLNKDGNYVHRVGLVTDQAVRLLASLMGVPNVDLTTKAQIVGDVHDAGLNPTAEVVVGLTPQAGQGPFYITTSGTKNPTPETSGAGIGFFMNVPPGTYELSFTHKTKKCGPWGTTVKNSAGTLSKMVAPAGWLIVTSGLCQ